MTNNMTFEGIIEQCKYYSKLKNNSGFLFEELTTLSKTDIEKTFIQFKPDKIVQPVNLLRFLLADALHKGIAINSSKIQDMKDAIENRDVGGYFNFNKLYLKNLKEYKITDKGMFPQWKNPFSVLYPFFYSRDTKTDVENFLRSIGGQIINKYSIENAEVHIVGFDGSQYYGADCVWGAVIPQKRNVQRAYQLFFLLNDKGIRVGLYKGEKLSEEFTNIDADFDSTEKALEYLGQFVERWKILNDEKKGLGSSQKKTPKHSLNKILFGPPGTGKTYHTINHAVAIIEEKTLEQIEEEYQHRRKDLIKRFEGYRDNKQIRFITFHQSFTYEDFVEGIKPRTIGEENDKKVIYEIEDGVFKEIVDDATSISKLSTNPERSNLLLSDEILNKINFFKISLGNTYSSEDDMIYDYCKANSVIAVGWGDDINFSDSKTEQDVIDKFLSIEGYKSKDYAIIAIKCLKFWMKKDDIVFISNGNKRVRAIGQISGDYFFRIDSEIRYNQFRPVKWLATDLDLPVDVIYERNFSQQTIYMMYKNLIKKSFFSSIKEEEDTNTSKNHVLIIDEINRGNVSQIFGELITLLEEDKRENAEMPMKITLPYSKKEFSVPSNLYIIGTMNTADRSVEALDTALRRRFSFEEMPPKYDLEELNYTVTEHIKAADILTKINLRLEKLLDKDHLIGHSFFICKEGETPLEKVKETFYKNIIPLLQEYFYGDYGKIGLVLGKKFVRKKDSSEQSVFAEFEGYESNFNEREVYEIIDYRTHNETDTFANALNILMK